MKAIDRARWAGLAFASIVVFAAMAQADWYDSGWLYRQELVLNNSASTTSLSNVPVLVHLTGSNFNFNSAQANGQDIRFTAADGSTLLNHEVESWDQAGQEAWVWVRVPQINAGSTSDKMYMYANNPSAAALGATHAQGTWEPDFHMVQHLNETEKTAGSYNDHSDATSYGNDGEYYAALYPGVNPGTMDAPGQIAGCDRFWGYDDWGTTPPPYDDHNRIDVPGDASLHSNPNITVEVWCKREEATAWEDHIVRTAGEWMLNYANGTTSTSVRFGRAGSGWGSPSVVWSGSGVSMDEWHYLVGTAEYDGQYTTLRIYVDGQEWNSTEAGPYKGTLAYAPDQFVRIGARNDLTGQSYFHGLIDEVRYSATSRSADWIQAQYLSMTGEFVTFGETIIPEPASVALLAGGLLALLRRRKTL
jgi:hypothetical protein